MLVRRQKTKSSPKMISKPKLITALALLSLHGAAGDDLCAPASTSAARRVYAAPRVARRSPRPRPHAQVSTAPSPVFDRGADGRADRTGLARKQRRKSTLPSKPGTLQTESKSGAASTPYWLRYGIRVERTPSQRLAMGPATRGLPAGSPGEPINT